uniref:Uncharacterized protein n=1 Tax=Noctiluca scintillans TaxID=2966 RepID=A0A7S1AB60_NOCSC|mmetsp:Transcript_39114/g.103867  ORF Transcript_39114/g.103867 Transcript_39114/m.103867 type:complete len:256 (+) Transcript_39114:103-870(+)
MFVLGKMAAAPSDLLWYFREELAAVQQLAADIIEQCTPTPLEEKTRHKLERKNILKRARAARTWHLQQIAGVTRISRAAAHRSNNKAVTDTEHEMESQRTGANLKRERLRDVGVRNGSAPADWTSRGRDTSAATHLKSTRPVSASSATCCAGISRLCGQFMDTTVYEIPALQEFSAEVIEACTPFVHKHRKKTQDKQLKKVRKLRWIEAQRAVAARHSRSHTAAITTKEEASLSHDREADAESNASSSTMASRQG